VFAIVSAMLGALIDAFRPRAPLVVEIVVLRQQLAVLKRARPRPPLRPVDRAFWVVVSRVWSRWADALAIVKPATVITGHRRGFTLLNSTVEMGAGPGARRRRSRAAAIRAAGASIVRRLPILRSYILSFARRA
jgi:hypothetical protein